MCPSIPKRRFSIKLWQAIWRPSLPGNGIGTGWYQVSWNRRFLTARKACVPNGASRKMAISLSNTASQKKWLGLG